MAWQRTLNEVYKYTSFKKAFAQKLQRLFLLVNSIIVELISGQSISGNVLGFHPGKQSSTLCARSASKMFVKKVGSSFLPKSTKHINIMTRDKLISTCKRFRSSSGQSTGFLLRGL